MKVVMPLITEEESRLPFYVTTIGARENQEELNRPSGYPDYHWIHCIKGKGKLYIENSEFVISEGMSFFFRPRIPHSYHSIVEPWETHWVTFQGYGAGPLLDALGIGKWGVFYLSNIQILDRFLNDIYVTAQSEAPVRGYECSALLYRFIIEIRNNISHGEISLKNSKQKKLQPVISFIEKNYAADPSLEQMSDIIGVTCQHLCRLFKQSYNMRPFVYLTHTRIRKAKELIIDASSLTIREIAAEVGYNDTSYFCSLFKEYEGVTPLEFRKMYGVE